ncbi:hypothetical protein [Micromonospora sagamiensis]|uniref:Uncharacterized protein n=1 Tax=Micromonospora sagamiensis TaxID=47875 RepID=A0A562WGC9_9ACTN|nr:hypothetical protein [Micromonospora sagamiensis]TWJ28957.1 hypothetical protein JD81_02463 [Micromonospora sagamiensis]
MSRATVATGTTTLDSVRAHAGSARRAVREKRAMTTNIVRTRTDIGKTRPGHWWSGDHE